MVSDDVEIVDKDKRPGPNQSVLLGGGNKSADDALTVFGSTNDGNAGPQQSVSEKIALWEAMSLKTENGGYESKRPHGALVQAGLSISCPSALPYDDDPLADILLQRSTSREETLFNTFKAAFRANGYPNHHTPQSPDDISEFEEDERVCFVSTPARGYYVLAAPMSSSDEGNIFFEPGTIIGEEDGGIDDEWQTRLGFRGEYSPKKELLKIFKTAFHTNGYPAHHMPLASEDIENLGDKRVCFVETPSHGYYVLATHICTNGNVSYPGTVIGEQDGGIDDEWIQMLDWKSGNPSIHRNYSGVERRGCGNVET